MKRSESSSFDSFLDSTDAFSKSEDTLLQEVSYDGNLTGFLENSLKQDPWQVEPWYKMEKRPKLEDDVTMPKWPTLDDDDGIEARLTANDDTFELPLEESDMPISYNMEISTEGYSKEHVPNGARYTYSHILEKFFFNKDVDCPLNLKINSPPPPGSQLVLCVKYKSYPSNPVKRCKDHLDESSPQSDRFLTIKWEDAEVQYSKLLEENLEHDCINVTTDVLQQTQNFTFITNFQCLSSCFAKLSLRELTLHIKLVYDSEELASCGVDFQVCTCPGRSRKYQEKRETPPQCSSSHDPHPTKEGIKQEIKPAQPDVVCTVIGTSESNKKIIQVTLKKSLKVELFEKFIERLPGVRLMKKLKVD